MVTTPAATSVPREHLWQGVEHAYAQLRLARVEHGDLSPEARIARRAVSQAWIRYESGAYFGLLARPVVTYRPLVGEVEVELPVDAHGIGYTVGITLDGRGAEAAAVTITPEPADCSGVLAVLSAAESVLADMEAVASGRGDVRGADVWSRAIIGLLLWRHGFEQALAEDQGADTAA